MSNYNPQGGGLQYRGTAAQAPPNCWFNSRDPGDFDTQGFSLLDLWLNTVTHKTFVLVSLAGSFNARRSIAVWTPLTAISLGAETLNGVAYGGGPGNPIQWTAEGGTNTVLAANNGAPFFTTHPTVTEVTITGTVTNPTDAATKAYVDSIAAGFSFITASLAATTANLTATYANGAAGVGATLTNSGAQAAIVIDGVSLSVNDRVLVKNQTTTFQNGVYKVTTVGTGVTNWVLTRATDYDQAPSEIKPGNIVPVAQGTLNANSLWLQTATVTTIGTDPIIFVPFGTNPVIPLPIAEGGTNTTAFSEINGTVYYDGTKLDSIDPGIAGEVLTSNGPSSPPSFQTNTGNVITTTYSTPGTTTWTRNVNTVVVEVYGWGSGAGGASTGGVGSTNGGGGGGGAFYYRIPASFLNATETVVVGAGGAGGVQGVNTGFGSDGEITKFGNLVSGSQAAKASPGSNYGGNGGFVFTQTQNAFFNYTVSAGFSGPANSGQGNNSGMIPDLNFGSMLPGGGGGSGNANLSLANGQAIINPATGAVIVAGGAFFAGPVGSGANGGDGYGASTNYMCGGGGGGGGTGATGNGGNGGFPGGGGGCGGTNGITNGNGGRGGDGLVIVLEYTQ